MLFKIVFYVKDKKLVALYIQTDIIDSTIDNNEFALCFSKVNDLKIEKKIKKL